MKAKQVLSKALAASIFAGAMLFSNSVFAQVKIGTNPTVIDPANNLEVESSTAGNKVSVNKTTGKVTIADGSQGAGRVLVSDANGVATWQNTKNTSIYSYGQPNGISINLPTAAGVCYTIACATDLGRTGTFTISNAVNDVVVDATGPYSIANNSTQLQFSFYLAVDKTTPGTFEQIQSFPILHSATGCGGGSVNLKSVLQNLPVRVAPYTIKLYASAFTNTGTPGILAIGGASVPGCGTAVTDQKLIVSVSQ